MLRLDRLLSSVSPSSQHSPTPMAENRPYHGDGGGVRLHMQSRDEHGSQRSMMFSRRQARRCEWD
jgi:hypothetical protein